MKRKYNYNLVEGEDKSLYYVKEEATGQIIESFKVFNEARAFMKHLNLGGGFDSWTPAFMIRKVKK